MPTANQLVRKGRKPRKRKNPGKALGAHAQLRGTVLKTYVVNPKKPNSADRKLARVKLSNGREVVARIPGEGHTIQQHASVLVIGGRAKDCPGVRYEVVRGALDASPVQDRRQARSRYGTRR